MPDPVLRWDSVAGRYRSASGQFVSDQAARAAVDELLATAAGRLEALTVRLQSGGLRLADWQEQMRGELRNVHGVLATVAHGGKAQMSPADYGRLSGRLRFQYERLNVFALDLAQGRVSGPQAASRARAYARAAYLTYAETLREDARRRGADEERWVRRASESCEGCKAQSDRGWVSVGTLPPLGGQPCKGNCRCVIMTRRVSIAEGAAA